ncbi:MAG TPA: galactose oxidase-like domain-containing protein [Gemmatimonadales bacterium]|nr:galactose oxidase-like domain-containing protein [Gemmatimonadales bacterium]
MKSVRLLLLGVAVVLAQGCSDEEVSHPNTMAAATAPTHYQLTIQDSSSAASGAVLSNKGGIACTFQVTSLGTVKTGICSSRYKAGANVFLTATPSIGAMVSHWSGCTPASDNPLSCQVRVNADATVKVTFAPKPNQYVLTVQGGAGGSGKVQSMPAGINCTITAGTAGATGCKASYPAGQSVVLKATAASGSYLKAWSGAGCDVSGTGSGTGSGSCTVSLSDTRSVVVSFETTLAQATKGAWGTPFAWPVVGIHASVLPNGKVLTFGRAGHNPALWDPASPATFGSTTRPADFFCSGHVLLPDGRLFVAGGHAGADNFGIKTTYFYDFATNSWTRGNDMRNGRWYPTTTVLPNGEVLTVSGGDTAGVMNTLPEVWQPDGAWRALTGAQISIAYYSMMFVAPDGRVFAAGPAQGTRYFTTAGTGSLAVGPTSHFGSRDYGSAVMYDAGKILIVGGNMTPTASAEVIDLNAGSGAAWRTVASMTVGRRQLNATLLADGKVLVTGGTNSTGFNVAPSDSRVLSAELWDPATEQWTTLARMSHQRVYHSSALLLPDGRVLSVGSGEPAATGLSDDYTAEIFSPPYLFKADGTPATRPAISSAPVSVGYGQGFTVTTPNASSITKVTWIRLSSVTHSFNQNQRMNRLGFSVIGTGTLSVTAPANSRLSPPGHYLLFLVNSAGVPSVARIIRIG